MSNKYPPVLGEDVAYERWRKEVCLWRKFTDLDEKKHALAIHFGLRGKAREASGEIEENDLCSAKGVDKILEKLDKMFLMDKGRRAFMAYQEFERMKRATDMTVNDYLSDFDRKYFVFKSHGMELPDAVLAFRLLESANISDIHFQLAMTTTGDITFESVRETLRKIFGSVMMDERVSSVKPEMGSSFDEIKPVLYGRENRRGGFQRSNVGGNRRGGYQSFGARVNPLGRDGKPSKCARCGSIYHWVRDCDSQPGFSRKNEEVQLTWIVRESDEEGQLTWIGQESEEKSLKMLSHEAFGGAVLDTGCTSTVCGREWLDVYLETLTVEKRHKVTSETSGTSFRFGDGKLVSSEERVSIPCRTAGRDVIIVTDVVDCDLPLLLSKKAMKKGCMKIDVENDTVEVLGVKCKLDITSSGHYVLPFEITSSVYEVMMVTERYTTAQRAAKLHRQFAHPSADRLISLIKDAGIEDHDLYNEVRTFSERCQVCAKLGRTPPRPVVSLPMAKSFNDVVAMDLKCWGGKYFLVMVDLFTRFCSSSVIDNKRPEIIIRNVCKIWISIFGSPNKFLSDNGGEFNNGSMRNMAENFNIKLLCTAAESPWSNGVCERLNAVIGRSVDRVMTDTGCDLEVALAWAVSARNALQNNHGYSPNQLVFGFNPVLPSMCENKPPALEGRTTSRVVADNLNAMHKAREEFVRMESNERIQRALSHQVRPSMLEDMKNGDSVFYKRADSQAWHGPGVVIGRDGKQVLVRHGGIYVRAHICRLQKSYVKDEVVKRDDQIIEVRGDKQEFASVKDTHSRNKGQQEESEDEETQEMPETETPQHEERVVPRGGLVGKRIQCRMNGSDQMITGKVMSRAGKATGRNSGCYNIIKDHDGEIQCFDLDREVLEWRLIEDSQEVLILRNSGSVRVAKEKEMDSWVKNDVFEEVEDRGQDRLSMRWVITEKIKDGEPVIKARLVARGFEEDLGDNRTDSPTCTKESLRMTMCLIAAEGWECRTIDIKAAFLQGQGIGRDVWLRPPPEFFRGYIWKLKKTVYGLNDAARAWYFRVKDELLKLGVIMCTLDPALFFWHVNGRLEGIICLHVDDFLWAGTANFEKSIMKGLASMFLVGSSSGNGSFRYVGINVEQDSKGISVHQSEYVSAIKPMDLINRSLKDKEVLLDEKEKHEYRSLVGQLNWIATQTRPDLSFDVCVLSSVFHTARVADVLHANKVVKRAIKQPIVLRFPKLDLRGASLECYSDASFANLADSGSQGGFVICLRDGSRKRCPLMWQSRRVRRVVKSTLAAETLALLDCAEAAVYLATVLRQMYSSGDVERLKIPVYCYSDNRSLVEAVHSTKVVEDRCLRINIAVVVDLLEKGVVDAVQWVDSAVQVADCLTKAGASCKNMISYITGN